MDLRSINELGFAIFGQLLDQKADFRILQAEGIIKNFNREVLEKIFQLPYGLEISPDREFLSFVKIAAQSGNYGPDENYIFIIGYKFAGIDRNKRRNYYGGCLAYKYNGCVISAPDALNYLSMIMDASKFLVINDKTLPLSLQIFKGVEAKIDFCKASSSNSVVVASDIISDEMNRKFIEYCYSHSIELAPVQRFILASGFDKIQGVNGYEIKVSELQFSEVLEMGMGLFPGKKNIFNEQENKKVMLENKNDVRFEEALNSKLSPLNEKIEFLENELSKYKGGGGSLKQNSGSFIKNIDKVFLVLIIIILAGLFLVFREIDSLTITTKASMQKLEGTPSKEFKKFISEKIDSLNRVKKDSSVIYVAGKKDDITKIAKMYNVSPQNIYNKNSTIKQGDTLLIKK